MQYRLDTVSGSRLSVLGYGCMRFPRNQGKVNELVKAAVDGGINYFDTAWMYPGNEEALGAALAAGGLREKVFIATKLPIVLAKGPGDFDRFFEQSLARLKTSSIDYYLMHMLTGLDSWEKLCSWGIREWIAGKKAQGSIRRVGFSFHGSGPAFLKILDAFDWEFCQIQYNYSDEHFQAGVTGLRRAAEKMPVIIMEPLLGGKLTVGLPKAAAAIFRRAVGTPAAWGLNWVWNQEEPTVILSGMGDMRQLEENLELAGRARTGMLGEDDMKVYAEVVAELRKSYRIRCTGCNYCMPCPRGVNIPGCFGAYNTLFSLGLVAGMQQYMTSTAPVSDTSAGPSKCVACGACERHCPQELPIIKHLKEVRAKMEPLPLRAGLGAIRFFLGR